MALFNAEFDCQRVSMVLYFQCDLIGIIFYLVSSERDFRCSLCYVYL